ncbi:MAG: error-prone DNA polymerase [Burkholderiales bacterium]|nr:error-prone DNA polymerase [Burkholderiales bacterium]
MPATPALPDYAELHCLSNFTFQRGASHAEELVARAHAMGYRALAITDECSLAGIVRAHVAAKDLGLKLIVGAEFKLVDGLRVVLLAPDREAYGDLSELITIGRRRADKGHYTLLREDLANLSQHMLALWLPSATADMADGHWLKQHFADRAWLAVELHGGPDDLTKLKQRVDLADACQLPCVAAGDVHMHARSRRMLHDVLTAIRLGKPVAECGQALMPNGERHLRSRMTLSLVYPAAMLAESVRIADRCTFSLDSLRYEYPQELVPPGFTPTTYLRQLTETGLADRYPSGVPESVRTQAEKELALIAKLHYEPFFLTVHDIVAYARRVKILCQGRGSAANSVVCFALHITEVDPKRGTLLFERFISEERDEHPDIDVDFEHERREEVIQYIYRKYGRERTALAATVISYRRRSALRDVGRALGFDEGQLDRLSNTLAWWDKIEDLPLRLAEAGFDGNSRSVQQLLMLTKTLQRFPRHLSQHVGGFIISSGPLARLVPIENAAMKDRTVIQWDKEDLEAMNLLKVDVLALGMLTAIRRCLALLAGPGHEPMTMSEIPAEDGKVYDMICKADTIGVFQIESRAQMSMLPRLRPRNFYDLVIEVALVRPGPIQGDMVHPYLARRQNPGLIEKLGPRVDAVLERTNGVPIFQEQVMQLAVVAADFTPGEADDLRRSMASWRRTGKLEQYRDKLKSGLLKNGYPESFADRILKQIEGFSEYGFPESHAASFAILVYISAWLKHYHPAAFACALVNSQPMGFYSTSQLVQDARRHNVEVRAIDVNASSWDCSLEPIDDAPPALRLGLRLVQGLAKAVGERIADQRPAGGYASLADLQARVQLDQRTLGLLADADALAGLAGHRRQARWQATGLLRQDDLIRDADQDTAPVALPAPTLGSDIVSDYQSTRLTLRAHPLQLLRPAFQREGWMTAADLRRGRPGQLARVCGLVVGRQRPGTAKGVTFVTLEDETGNTNVVVWAELAERHRQPLLNASLLAVHGVIEREGDVVHLLAQYLSDKSSLLGRLEVASRDFH